LAHAPEASPLAGHTWGRGGAALIDDTETEVVLIDAQRDLDQGSWRVLGHVGQRLLEDAIGRPVRERGDFMDIASDREMDA